MRVLITGGAGFIGSHLTDELLARGHKVRVLDDLSSGDLENLSQHQSESRLEFIEGGITNREEVQKSLKNVDAVIHAAAITSVPLSIEKPGLTKKVNVEGTDLLLEESLKEDIERFVYSSSCAVYGKTEKIPIEERNGLDPISPYGESKLTAENRCKKYAEKGLETVCLRYFNVYGPRQGFGPYAGVILKFFERLKNDKPPVIYGDGEQTRDFVYVDDIVNGTLLGLEKDGVSGESFNIGSGNEISINELCEEILKISGRDIKPEHEEPKEGDIRRSRADLSKSRKILGYEPTVSLKEGLLELAENLDI